MTRHRCSVAKAASPPASPPAPGCQKRRRERRTYHPDRSSRKVWILRPAAVASYRSIRSRTTPTVSASCDRIHRSIGSVGVASTSSASTPLAFAYVTKKA